MSEDRYKQLIRHHFYAMVEYLTANVATEQIQSLEARIRENPLRLSFEELANVGKGYPSIEQFKNHLDRVDILLKYEGNKKITTFIIHLYETIFWCSSRINISDPKYCLRSTRLLPSKTMSPENDGIGIWADQYAIDAVIGERSNLVSASINQLNIEKVLSPRGNLLLHIINYSNHNGLTSHISDGFFDDNDTPPWDTWIDTVGSNFEEINFLVSWIPQPFVKITQTAIDNEAVGMLVWAHDHTSFFQENFQDVHIPQWLVDISQSIFLPDEFD